MPGTCPSVNFSKLVVDSVATRVETFDQTNRYTEKFLRQTFQFGLETAYLERAAGTDLFGFLCNNGPIYQFQMPLPTNLYHGGTLPSGTTVATYLTNRNKGAEQITYQITAGSTGSIGKGAFFKFANHNKLYRFKEADNDATSGLVHIFPPLVTAVPSGTQITFNPTFTAKLIDEKITKEYATHGYMKLKFTVREDY